MFCRSRLRSSDLRTDTQLRFFVTLLCPQANAGTAFNSTLFPIRYSLVTLTFSHKQSAHRKPVVKKTKNHSRWNFIGTSDCAAAQTGGLTEDRITFTEIPRFLWPLKWKLLPAWIDTVQIWRFLKFRTTQSPVSSGHKYAHFCHENGASRFLKKKRSFLPTRLHDVN